MPVTQVNPVLVDGTLAMVILSCVMGIIRMAAPGVGNMLRSKQQAELDAQTETRKAELAADAKTQDAMHKLIESYAKAEQSQSTQLTEAVVNRVIVALDLITQTQSELVKQSSEIARTQESIASTQQRTLEILLHVEQRLDADQRLARRSPRLRSEPNQQAQA